MQVRFVSNVPLCCVGFAERRRGPVVGKGSRRERVEGWRRDRGAEGGPVVATSICKLAFDSARK